MPWVEKYIISLVILLPLGMLMSCNAISSKSDGDTLLAEINHAKLYYSDIQEKLPRKISGADSTALVASHIEQWIHKTLLTEKAENQFGESPNIKALTDQYRNDLLIHELEKELIATFSDTIIDEAELKQYYQKYQNDFESDTDYFLVEYAIVDEKAKGIDRFFESWKKKEKAVIEAFCIKSAEYYCIDENCWKTAEELAQLGISTKYIKENKSSQYNKSSTEYFIRVRNKIEKGDIKPYSKTKAEIKAILLHRRKRNILQDEAARLKEDMLKRNKIKNYLKLVQ